MPSFNVSLPQIPKRFDLRDVVDPIDRKIEVADQAAVLLLSTVQSLKLDPTTGAAYTAGSYLAPGYVDTDRTAYEAAVDAAITAATTALTNLKSIASMV